MRIEGAERIARLRDPRCAKVETLPFIVAEELELIGPVRGQKADPELIRQ
jgi:hypothetical protein